MLKKKKNMFVWKARGIILYDFKMYCKATVIKKCNVRIKVDEQWNRIEKLEITTPHRYG